MAWMQVRPAKLEIFPSNEILAGMDPRGDAVRFALAGPNHKILVQTPTPYFPLSKKRAVRGNYERPKAG